VSLLLLCGMHALLLFHLFLSPHTRVFNWVTTGVQLCWILLGRIGCCDHAYNWTRLNWQEDKCLELLLVNACASWVVSSWVGLGPKARNSNHRAWFDQTQPAKLSWIGCCDHTLKNITASYTAFPRSNWMDCRVYLISIFVIVWLSDVV